MKDNNANKEKPRQLSRFDDERSVCMYTALAEWKDYRRRCPQRSRTGLQSSKPPEPPLPRHHLRVELDKVDGERRNAAAAAAAPPARCARAIGARSGGRWGRRAAVHVPLGEGIDVRGLWPPPHAARRRPAAAAASSTPS